jgi:hypothetical protein
MASAGVGAGQPQDFRSVGALPLNERDEPGQGQTVTLKHFLDKNFYGRGQHALPKVDEIRIGGPIWRCQESGWS